MRSRSYADVPTRHIKQRIPRRKHVQRNIIMVICVVDLIRKILLLGKLFHCFDKTVS